MKIIILGAGSVGVSVAETLLSEQNDIVVIDTNSKRIRDLQDKLDVAIVVGHASHPHILRKVGAEDAEMIIAVTDNDEINMIACQLAYSLFRIPTKVCRIRSNAYFSQNKLFAKEHLPIDFVISPERLVTTYIERLLEYPGALQVVDFAEDRVRLVGVNAIHGAPLVDKKLHQITKFIAGAETRIAAIFRRDHSIKLDGNTVIEAGDEVFFIAATEHTATIMHALHGVDKVYKRIMIAGGGNIGAKLALAIEQKYHVKIIDRSLNRCEQLSDILQRTLVLHGNPSDRDLLTSEDIDTCDAFLAVTSDDETNIMASLLAKKLGANKVITLITNMAYVDLLQGGQIDIALSPQQITIGSLLRHVRRGEVSNVYSLRRGVAEAIEITARGDAKSSRVVGRKLEDINLPTGVSIGAIVRGDKVIIAHSNALIETDDHVILFLANKNRIRDVEKLFQVGFTFI